jgi:hypothetical protein
MVRYLRREIKRILIDSYYIEEQTKMDCKGLGINGTNGTK